jgi:hypothetical protein
VDLSAGHQQHIEQSPSINGSAGSSDGEDEGVHMECGALTPL